MKLLLTALLTAISLQATADITTALPKTDAFGKTARAIGVQLRDSNISTGTTELWAGQLKKQSWFSSSNEFKAYVQQGFAQAFKEARGSALPADAKLEVTAAKFVDGDSKAGTTFKMTSAVIESNDYNPTSKELRDSQARYLWVVLRKFPVSDQTWVGHVKTRLMNNTTESLGTVQYFLLVNRDRKAVQFFTVEGTM